jgi:1-acyl-sn-glycerol-3-phosphate acyltransferase
MKITHPFICWIIKIITRILFRIDRYALNDVPIRGPMIIVSNHIDSLEVPLIYAHLQPRKIHGLAKIETWDNPLMGWLFDLFQAIPVRRGEADLEAIRRSLEVLKAGDILAVAPEGTRSRTGRLLKGQPGIAMLAMRSNTSILPLAHWGSEKLSENIRSFRRTDFHIRVGKPFHLDPGGIKVTGEIRQEMTDEIMCQIAQLLPEEYHGEYLGCRSHPVKYIRYDAVDPNIGTNINKIFPNEKIPVF